MRIHILAAGRLRSGPEQSLTDDYLRRFNAVGRGVGLGPAHLVEIDGRQGRGKAYEAGLFERKMPAGAVLCALDERGFSLSSPEFAGRLAAWRDAGRSDLALMVGGADGLDRRLCGEADFMLSFGKMVWPHFLARVMLAEQLYRAATILAGAPYHRN